MGSHGMYKNLKNNPGRYPNTPSDLFGIRLDSVPYRFRVTRIPWRIRVGYKVGYITSVKCRYGAPHKLQHYDPRKLIIDFGP